MNNTNILIDGRTASIEVLPGFMTNAPSLTVWTDEGIGLEPQFDITTETSIVPLNKNEIAVNASGEASNYIETLLESDYFEDTKKRVIVEESQEIQIWKMNAGLLK